MDRDTLQDDLDLIFGPTRDAEPPGEWDWEPPLGTVAPASSSPAEPEETEEPDAQAPNEQADDPADEDD